MANVSISVMLRFDRIQSYFLGLLNIWGRHVLIESRTHSHGSAASVHVGHIRFAVFPCDSSVGLLYLTFYDSISMDLDFAVASS